MVITKIVCDTPLCRHKGRAVSGEGARAQVRKLARKQGWLCGKELDLCPECAKAKK